MVQSTKRTASTPRPCPILKQSCHSALLGSPPLGPCQAPALPGTMWIHTLLSSPPLGPPLFRPHQVPAPCETAGSMPYQASPVPSSAWGHQLHTLPGQMSLRPCQATALQACWIAALPDHCSRGHHRKATNLPETKTDRIGC
jgi:hypothetical protein